MNVTFEFPVWEVLSTVLVSGVVTWVTISLSIRAAREETQRTLDANAESERAARAARAEEISDEIARADRRERGALSATLMAAVIEMDAVRDLPIDDQRRIEAKATWKATRAVFDGSPVKGAPQMYLFAELRIEEGLSAAAESTDALTYLDKSPFVEHIRLVATTWAESGRFEKRTVAKLTEMVERKDAARRAKGEALFRELSEATPESDAE